jgi:hypothetical protein
VVAVAAAAVDTAAVVAADATKPDRNFD